MIEITKVEDLEIERVLTLNTCHISKETADFLSKEQDSVICFTKSEYGWFIACNEEDATCLDVPEDLEKLMMMAIAADCCWLCLDRDGVEANFLHKYEW